MAVGTALTIDAIASDATDPSSIIAEGRHLGGQIMPGPTMMLESLLKGTSDIAERTREGSAKTQFFATDTPSAVRQGIQNILCSSVMESLRQLSHLTGKSPALIVTGGASDWLTSVLPIASQTIPDLVLRGLALSAKQNIPNQAKL